MCVYIVHLPSQVTSPHCTALHSTKYNHKNPKQNLLWFCLAMAMASLLRTKVNFLKPTLFSRSFSKFQPKPSPTSESSNTPIDLPIIETFNLDTITPKTFKAQTESVQSHFSLFKQGEPFRVVRAADRNSIESYFNIKIESENHKILGLYGYFDYWPLAVQSGSKLFVINQPNFKHVPAQIYKGREVIELPVGYGGYNVPYSYQGLCNGVARLSQGVVDGNGADYSADLSRLLGLTTLSARFPGFCRLVQRALAGDRVSYEKPDDGLMRLVRNWGKISAYIRGGGVGTLVLDDDEEYNLANLRELITLINKGEFPAAAVVKPTSCMDEFEVEQDGVKEQANQDGLNEEAGDAVDRDVCIAWMGVELQQV